MLVAAVEEEDGPARGLLHGRPVAIEEIDAVVRAEGALDGRPGEGDDLGGVVHRLASASP
jgi:hypothetical protein